jgi:hypothetical protein
MGTQIIKGMDDKDTIANGISAAGIFAYLMQFQNEITILVLITGLILNLIRIVDRVRSKKKGDN